MSDTPWKKKLIEVALPLDAINAESARENFIYKRKPFERAQVVGAATPCGVARCALRPAR